MTATLEAYNAIEPRPMEAEQAEQTLREIERMLDEQFDLDGMAYALAAYEPGQDVNWSEFERPRLLQGNPAHFYKRHANDHLGAVSPTPMQCLNLAHETLGDSLVLDKREDTQQFANTFKVRGAMMAALKAAKENPDVRTFTAASAGNHAAGLLQAVRVLNEGLIASGQMQLDEHGQVSEENKRYLYKAHIYCADSISEVKYQRLVSNGATVFNTFASLEEAMVEAEIRGESADSLMIHPFDDEVVAAGQATMGLELLFDLKDQGVDLLHDDVTVRIPVGGGGLFAGMATVWEWAKARGLLNPNARLVGVEMEGCDSATREQAGMEPLTLETMDKDTEGLATLQAGRKTLPVISSYSTGMTVVPKEYVVIASAELLKAHDNIPPELAGVVSLASTLFEADSSFAFANHSRAVHVTLTTGSNVAPSMLSKNCSEFIAHPNPTAAAAARQLGGWVFQNASRNQLEWAQRQELEDPSVVLAPPPKTSTTTASSSRRSDVLLGHVVRR